MAVIQTSAELYREPISCPHRFPCFAQTGLVFGGIPSVVEALRHGGNFTRQRPEHVQIRHSLAVRDLPGAERAHPQRRPGNRTGDAPANNQQRNQNNEKDLGQHTKECSTPDKKDLRVYVARIVHHGEAAQHCIPTANRQRENVHRQASRPDERALLAALTHGLLYRCRTRGERLGHVRSQFRSYRDQSALPVVDGDTQQVLPVPEALHQPLQVIVGNVGGSVARNVASRFASNVTGPPVRACSPGLLNIADQALAQHLSATLQCPAQSAFFPQHFVIGKTGRNERDAQNERNNQPNTQQSHAQSFTRSFDAIEPRWVVVISNRMCTNAGRLAPLLGWEVSLKSTKIVLSRYEGLISRRHGGRVKPIDRYRKSLALSSRG